MKRYFKAVIIAVAMSFALSASSFAGSGTRLNEDDIAPNFTLKNILTDEEVTLTDYRGKKIVLIQFWATWCALCKREIPFLVNHYNENKKRDDFEILAVLLPSGKNDKRDVKEIVEKYNIPYPILLDADKKLAEEKYGLTGFIPVLLFIDKDGKIYYEHTGELSASEDIIEMVLEELRGEVEE